MLEGPQAPQGPFSALHGDGTEKGRSPGLHAKETLIEIYWCHIYIVATGPLRFEGDGQLAADIREAIDETGFYIFEGLLDGAELDDLDADVDALLARTPRT